MWSFSHSDATFVFGPFRGVALVLDAFAKPLTWKLLQLSARRLQGTVRGASWGRGHGPRHRLPPKARFPHLGSWRSRHTASALPLFLVPGLQPRTGAPQGPFPPSLVAALRRCPGPFRSPTSRLGALCSLTSSAAPGLQHVVGLNATFSMTCICSFIGGLRAPGFVQSSGDGARAFRRGASSSNAASSLPGPDGLPSGHTQTPLPGIVLVLRQLPREVL